MENKIHVMKHVLELSQTMGEALEHIKAQVNEGQEANTIELANDTMSAFASIIQSMGTFLGDLPKNKIEEYTNILLKSFDVLATTYEQQQGVKTLEVLQFNVLPAYKKWKEELENQLQRYVVS
ncbi:hypothetical protein [Aneurinibacillus aneurinilyticus]|jgi:hypothetical protein|uniref:hypothetical protein n=1 Tax=Aneurinibacillus aneurinilyticus TaxID=1391 RepID=UPI003524FD23